MSDSIEASGASTPPTQPRGMRPLLFLPVAIFLAVAALFAVRLGSGDPSRVPSVLIGRPAPSFALPPLEGSPLPGLSSADLAKGQVTVLNVWASWCAPCRIEHPLLMELARDPAVKVVGLNYKDRPDAAQRFLATLGNPFSALGADENGRAAIEWGVYGVPETFVVGPDGTVRHKHVGPLTPEGMADFRAKIRAASGPPR
ncbi:DsbE family thiol:disulfide interchange protein [Enterovirga sp.]|jgi:cytochrome c biogenesis protein CcmG/thiol:disulfide interchange protein DsbE|uniref:DsbE family thiol:disulfide interchange protein n=1 Tax=Enterovirga sp. TaxID=2026350 RepID=UPI0026336C41|nr:DsbE family thiol:disulfide interchange protein [Enterovirga sp.]MDB5590056.1 thiol:disulfide interchange protein [Enterovirga sp.]